MENRISAGVYLCVLFLLIQETSKDERSNYYLCLSCSMCALMCACVHVQCVYVCSCVFGDYVFIQAYICVFVHVSAWCMYVPILMYMCVYLKMLG